MELIVVLVILAILASLLVPALTGYIDKANQQKVIASARYAYVAAQTIASENYGLGYTSGNKTNYGIFSNTATKYDYTVLFQSKGDNANYGNISSSKKMHDLAASSLSGDYVCWVHFVDPDNGNDTRDGVTGTYIDAILFQQDGYVAFINLGYYKEEDCPLNSWAVLPVADDLNIEGKDPGAIKFITYAQKFKS